MSVSSLPLAKRCSVCEVVKDLDRFCADNRSPGGKQSQCKNCQNEYRKTRYAEDPVYRARVNAKNKRNYKPGTAKASAKKRRQLRIDIVADAKAQPCTDCGRCFPPAAMDFDHVRGKKKAPIARLVYGDAPISVLLDELAKCDIRCAVCHRLRHHGDGS